MAGMVMAMTLICQRHALLPALCRIWHHTLIPNLCTAKAGRPCRRLPAMGRALLHQPRTGAPVGCRGIDGPFPSPALYKSMSYLQLFNVTRNGARTHAPVANHNGIGYHRRATIVKKRAISARPSTAAQDSGLKGTRDPERYGFVEYAQAEVHQP